MPEHRFVVGQLVRLRSYHGTSSRTSQTFQITGKLPARDSSPQYRMRNDSERHERVMTEDMLEEIAQILPVAHRQSS